MTAVRDPHGAPHLHRTVALVVIAWAVSEPLLLDGTASRWAALALGLCVAGPLLLVRRAPVIVAAVVVAAYLAQYASQLRMSDAMSGEMAVAFALFGLGAYLPHSWRRTALAVGLAAAVPGGLWVISKLDLGKVEAVYVTQYLYLCGVAFAGVLPGFALSGRHREVQLLEAEVEDLCTNAAIEIGVAVTAERRALARDLVRVVEDMIVELQRQVAGARPALASGSAMPERLGAQMAEAAGRAADRLRAALTTLGIDSGAPTEHVRSARRAPTRPSASTLRSVGGLALPVVLLAVLTVVDRAELPTLPVTVQTLSGSELTIPSSQVSDVAGYALALLTPVGLLWRRRAPLVAVLGVAAVVAIRAAAGEINSLMISHVFVLGALAYNAGAWTRSRRSALAALAITLGVIALCWHLEQYRFEPLVYAYMIGVLLATWGVGRRVHDDLVEAFALRARATDLRAQRDHLKRAAIRGERRDIAREMHDVVGHGLSLIVVQSGVVDVLARRDPARAGSALDQVEAATRITRSELAALRAALGEAPAPATADAFCRATLERIVDQARDAGQPVLAHIDHHVDELGADQRATLVRIAQEALTNARKYAGSAPTVLEVAVRPDAVELEVRNGAPSPRARPVLPSTGLGLEGMRERARALGGEVTAGPIADGWVVRAELPRELRVPAAPLVAT